MLPVLGRVGFARPILNAKSEVEDVIGIDASEPSIVPPGSGGGDRARSWRPSSPDHAPRGNPLRALCAHLIIGGWFDRFMWAS